MAVSIEGGGGGPGRRKPVDSDLLLVPYIDLLTCMVAFLLISAVWTQLARLQVQQKGQGQTDGDTVTPQTKIAVLVHKDGFAVIANQDQKPVPRARDQYDYAALTVELQRLKNVFPDKTDLQVLSEDAILFDTLVKTMDAAMTSGFPDISLLDAAGSPL
jgi:biopolymer transport protein ExbD